MAASALRSWHGWKIRKEIIENVKIKVKIVSHLSMKAENQCEIIRFSNSPIHQKKWSS